MRSLYYAINVGKRVNRTEFFLPFSWVYEIIMNGQPFLLPSYRNLNCFYHVHVCIHDV